nr:MAG TPA: hypothetical protein [Caudoviricetes sp.]
MIFENPEAHKYCLLLVCIPYTYTHILNIT